MSSIFLEVGEKFLPSPSVEFCGGFHTGLSRIPRVAWISGSEPPPAVSTPITRLLCRVSRLSCLARLPLRRAFGFHFYTAAQGGSPFYSVTMVDDLSVTRCGFQRSRCVGFWCHRASLALPPGKPPAALGVSPLTVFIIAPTGLFVKHFFFIFFNFFLVGGVPFPRPVAGNPLESLPGAHTSLGQRFILCFYLVGLPSYPLIRGCPSCEVLPRGALTADGMGL